MTTRSQMGRRTRAVALGSAAAMIAAAVVASSAQTRPVPAPPVTLSVDGRASANVSLAANAGVVAAAWAASLPGGSTDIYAAVSRDGGVTFGQPVRVNEKSGDAHVTGEQPPRIAIRAGHGAPPQIEIVWTSTGKRGGTIVSARSVDAGKTFGPTATIPGGEAAGNRGWENVAIDRAGRVHVVWLDHRELAPSASMTHMAEHHVEPAASKRDAVETAQRSKLYTAVLDAPASVHAITGGVCYCCKTAIAVGSGNDDIYLAWRQVYPQNVRDMAFTESHDGGRTFAPPARISEDKWQIEGCPEDGPALAVDGRGRIHVAWPTLVHDAPGGPPSIGIFYALSSGDHHFGPRQRVPSEGVPHHPQIAVARNTLYMAWDELENGARRVVLAHRPVMAANNAPWAREVVSNSLPGTYPSLVATDSGVLIGWTSNAPDSVIRVAPAK